MEAWSPPTGGAGGVSKWPAYRDVHRARRRPGWEEGGPLLLSFSPSMAISSVLDVLPFSGVEPLPIGLREGHFFNRRFNAFHPCSDRASLRSYRVFFGFLFFLYSTAIVIVPMSD